MNASDSVLIRRYKESRRVHPVDGNGSIENSIKTEREILRETMLRADYVIDMGPGGGKNGGNIIATGTPEQIATGVSPTASYIAAEL